MSRALDTWYSLPDLDRLARLDEPMTGEIAIGKLPRLAALLASRDGTVDATIELKHRSDGRLQFGLHCAAVVELICQRCLEPYSQKLAGDVEYLLVDEQQTGAGGSAGRGDSELLALAGERLNPKELIEDELIVSLPFAPRHAVERDCGSLARKLEQLRNDNGGPGGRSAEN